MYIFSLILIYLEYFKYQYLFERYWYFIEIFILKILVFFINIAEYFSLFI
jgi:hypothetical protein